MRNDRELPVWAWSLVWYLRSEKKGLLGKLVLDRAQKGTPVEFPGDERATEELERAWRDWILEKKCPPVGKREGTSFVTTDGVAFDVPVGFELAPNEDLLDVLESVTFASGTRRFTITVVAPEEKTESEILQVIAQLRLESFSLRGAPEKVDLRKGTGTRYVYDGTARNGGLASGEALVVPYDGQLFIVMGDGAAVREVAKTLAVSGE
jgi:hypothetical protein